MSREIRMVPPGWQHPTELRLSFRTGSMQPQFIGLLGHSFPDALAEWQEERTQWDMGLMRDYATNGWKPRDRDDIAFEDWYGEMPRAEDFMPEFPQGTATHMMMYETTSEGTPISPAFATAEELARWLADNNASAFGGTGATYEQWLSTIHRGFAPSTVLTATGIVSGVEALDKESGT